MTIILPIPSPVLNPNRSHEHWRGRNKAAQQARRLAKLTTLSALQATPPPAFTGYRLKFFHPFKRKRDDDNAAAACKAYRDGIADALRMDDNALTMRQGPEMAIDPANPRLEFILLP